MAGTLLSLVLLAGVAVGAGALLSPFLQSLRSGSEAVEGALPDESFQVATSAPPVIQPPAAPAPSQVTTAAAQSPLAQSPLAKASETATAPKAQKVAARTPRPAKRTAVTEAKPEVAAESWEKQKREYDEARASYDANERAAGRRWAQQNRIRIERHCRAAEQRNAAFVEGCLAFARSGKTASLD